MNGWTGTSDWKTVSRLLVSDTNGVVGLIWSPFHSPVADYAVEAEIEGITKAERSPAWGVLTRGDATSQSAYYFGGVLPIRVYGGPMTTISYRCPEWGPLATCDIVTREGFAPKNDYHQYRLEAKGNHLRLQIDGALILETDDNRFPTGVSVGLSSASQINVRSFRVIAL